MNKKPGSYASVFLMEMIVAVFFFMLCASTCILAFAKSNRLSSISAHRNHAVTVSETIGEIWKLEGLEGISQRLSVKKLTPGVVGRSGTPMPEGSYVIYYDNSWQDMELSQNNFPETEFSYTMWIREEDIENNREKLSLSTYEGERAKEPLFTMEVFRYGK